MKTHRKSAHLLAAIVVLVVLTVPLVYAQPSVNPGQPTPEQVDYQMGLSFQSHGNDDLAINEFDAAIRLQPTLVEAYVARADSYMALKDYDLAIADYTEALKLKSGDDLVYAKRGFAFAARGDLRDAQHDFEHVAKAEFLF